MKTADEDDEDATTDRVAGVFGERGTFGETGLEAGDSVVVKGDMGKLGESGVSGVLGVIGMEDRRDSTKESRNLVGGPFRG